MENKFKVGDKIRDKRWSKESYVEVKYVDNEYIWGFFCIDRDKIAEIYKIEKHDWELYEFKNKECKIMKNEFKVGDKIRGKKWNKEVYIEIKFIDDETYFGYIYDKDIKRCEYSGKKNNDWELYETEEDKKIREVVEENKNEYIEFMQKINENTIILISNAIEENNKKWIECIGEKPKYDREKYSYACYESGYEEGIINAIDEILEKAKKMGLIK